jgi:hypothetical protein
LAIAHSLTSGSSQPVRLAPRECQAGQFPLIPLHGRSGLAGDENEASNSARIDASSILCRHQPCTIFDAACRLEAFLPLCRDGAQIMQARSGSLPPAEGSAPHEHLLTTQDTAVDSGVNERTMRAAAHRATSSAGPCATPAPTTRCSPVARLLAIAAPIANTADGHHWPGARGAPDC